MQGLYLFLDSLIPYEEPVSSRVSPDQRFWRFRTLGAPTSVASKTTHPCFPAHQMREVLQSKLYLSGGPHNED